MSIFLFLTGRFLEAQSREFSATRLCFIADVRYFFQRDKNFIVTRYGLTSRSSITHSFPGILRPQKITCTPIKVVADRMLPR